MKQTTAPSKKRDLILVLVLLALAAALAGGYYLTHRTPAMRAEVTVDGELVEVLDLSKDQEVTIQGPHGGSNVLVVQNGEIWCSEATCPDKVCIHQGKQSMSGEIIVCLPNYMMVQVIGQE